MTEAALTEEVAMIDIQMVTMMITTGMTLDHIDTSMTEVSSVCFGWYGQEKE